MRAARAPRIKRKALFCVSARDPRLSVSTQPEAAILESHGIEVPSPSCHSNGEEGEMHEFADQVNQRFSEQASRLGAA